MDYDALATKTRPALIIAAMRRTPVTYGELGTALGLDDAVPLSHHLSRVLDIVSKQCIAAREPSLAVLVVAKESGEPGPGFKKGSVPCHQEARQCYRYWPPA
jgi:hypothetical protein